MRWVEADLAALTLPPDSFDAIRTERVLMYLPGDGFARVLGDLVRLLRPGGRLALFELDYGATMLAPGHADVAQDRQGHRDRGRAARTGRLRVAGRAGGGSRAGRVRRRVQRRAHDGDAVNTFGAV